MFIERPHFISVSNRGVNIVNGKPKEKHVKLILVISSTASAENKDRSKYIFITTTIIVIICENFNVEHDSGDSLLQSIGCLNVFEVTQNTHRIQGVAETANAILITRFQLR